MIGSGPAFIHPIQKPLTSLTRTMPLSAYNFLATGTLNQALVYQDAFLQVPYSGQPTADAAGNFAPIYLDPKTTYRVQLRDQNGNLVYDIDPYIVPVPGLGNGPIQVNPITGEAQINPPAMFGGSGITLTTSRSTGGNFAITCPGNASNPGQPLLQFTASGGLIYGAATANFSSVTNKPGSATNTVALWLPILGDNGVIFYIPLWS